MRKGQKLILLYVFLSQHGFHGIIFFDFFGQNTCWVFLQSVSNKVNLKLLFQEKKN